jgi:hypothetical protein
MLQLITFEEALNISKALSKRHLLTGNGFSIACRKDIFCYDSLFEQANFDNLNSNIKNVFQFLNTKDFELVMKHLRYARDILKVYSPSAMQLITQLDNDANELKNILVNAIASSHPENPSEILDEEYESCKKFLKNFNHCYTLNYDLLMYWTFMHYQNADLSSDDGFRTPDTGKQEYVSWDIEKTDGQNLFYLHGALHIFDAGSELQKYTWVNTGVRLIEQIRNALDHGKFPLFVSEGASHEKTDRIMHSNYLSRGLRSFSHIGGSLFVYGHSLAENDSHILTLIPKTKIQMLFISLFGDISHPQNRVIIETAQSLVSKRKGNNKINLYFYDSLSTHVWH